MWPEVYGQDVFHLHPLDLPFESFDHLSSDEYLSHHLARGGELQVIVGHHYAHGHLLGPNKVTYPLLQTVAESNKILQGLWLEASDGDGKVPYGDRGAIGEGICEGFLPCLDGVREN